MPTVPFSFVALLDQCATSSTSQVKREPEHETVYFIDRTYIPGTKTVIDHRPSTLLTPRQVKQEPDETFYWANSDGQTAKDYYRGDWH